MVPTREECRAAIAVLRAADPSGAELPFPDYFTLRCLDSFVAGVRQRNSEWTPAHLCRMVTGCPAQTHGVCLDDLLHAATLGAYAADWQEIVRLAVESGRRRGVIDDEVRGRRTVPMPPPKGAGGGWAKVRRCSAAPSSLAATERPGSTSPRRPAATAAAAAATLPSLAATAAAAAAPMAASPRPNTARSVGGASAAPTDGGDPFRDANGRRRLFLPVREHPPWSCHADGGDGDAAFEALRVNDQGITVAEAQRRAALAAAAEFRLVNNVMKRHGSATVGRKVHLGRKGEAGGAIVVELNAQRAAVFHRFHRQRHLVPQTRPDLAAIQMPQPPRVAIAPQTARTRTELKKLIDRLNDFC